MNDRESTRTTIHWISWILLAAVPAVLLAIAADLGFQSPEPSSLSTPSPMEVATHTRRPPAGLQGEQPDVVGAADGVVPDGVTVFDDEYPAVARLDPALLGALRQAATDAARDGIDLYVNSGWRSPRYQEQLLQEAISQYGSAAEAARWVATPSTSAHVTGHAVDIGPSAASSWLSAHGSSYGLCQIYRNEPWHFELRPEAVEHGCPPMYADPTQDPRMQR